MLFQSIETTFSCGLKDGALRFAAWRLRRFGSSSFAISFIDYRGRFGVFGWGFGSGFACSFSHRRFGGGFVVFVCRCFGWGFGSAFVVLGCGCSGRFCGGFRRSGIGNRSKGKDNSQDKGTDGGFFHGVAF